MTYSVAGIRARLTAGEVPTAEEVLWLVETLELVVAAVNGQPEPADMASSDRETTPSDDELVAEFGLGPNPSADMLAYLRDFVRDRAAEAEAETEG